MKKPRRFTDVEFASEYPLQSVAEHEIFLRFKGDSQAALFHDWWHESGAIIFQAWVDKHTKEMP